MQEAKITPRIIQEPRLTPTDRSGFEVRRRDRQGAGRQFTKRIAPNLLERDFNAPAPNQVLPADITYISTSDGWLYLAVLRYGSDDYLSALEKLGARPSMSRKGDRWDNAVSESFFATLEKELLALQPLQSRRNTRQQVASYIERYCGLVRIHSHLDSVSPVEFETNAPS